MTEKYLWAGGAAVAGLMLGYVVSDSSGRTDALQTQLDAMQSEMSAKLEDMAGTISSNATAIGALSGGLTDLSGDIGDKLAALGASSEALVSSDELQPLAQSLDALRDRAEDHGSALSEAKSALAGLENAVKGVAGDQAALKDSLQSVRGEMMAAIEAARSALTAPAQAGQAAPAQDAAASAPAQEETPAPPQPSEAERLAAQIGDAGLVLRVGQTATVGGERVFLSRLTENGAVLRVIAEGKSVRDGTVVSVSKFDGAARISDGCEITLAGVAESAAYMTFECAPAPASEEPASDMAETTAEAESTDDGDDGASSAALAREAAKAAEAAEAQRLAALIGSDGLKMTVGQTSTVGETRLFLSRMSDDGAHFRIDGHEVVASIYGEAEPIGGGCSVTLAGMVSGAAYLTSACDDQTAPAAVETAAQAAPADLSLTVGQTGHAGDYRVFLSRIEKSAVKVLVFSLDGARDSAVLHANEPHIFGGDCGIALSRIKEGTADLVVACGDAVAGLFEMATEIAPDAAISASAEPSVAPAPSAAPGLADKISDNGIVLGVGQAASVGDARIFLKRLPGDSALFQVVGGGEMTVDVFRPADLGNGCSVSLLGVEGGKAYLEPSCS